MLVATKPLCAGRPDLVTAHHHHQTALLCLLPDSGTEKSFVTQPKVVAGSQLIELHLIEGRQKLQAREKY